MTAKAAVAVCCLLPAAMTQAIATTSVISYIITADPAKKGMLPLLVSLAGDCQLLPLQLLLIAIFVWSPHYCYY